MNAARVLALCAAATLSGCLQGDYNRDRMHQALGPVDVVALRPGVDDLEAVLARLGAPLIVRELGTGAALAYGWLDQTGWNIEAQVPVGDAGSFQLAYASSRQELPGLVVFLDEAQRVTRVERGLLKDLLPDKPRPRLVEAQPEGG